MEAEKMKLELIRDVMEERHIQAVSDEYALERIDKILGMSSMTTIELFADVPGRGRVQINSEPVTILFSLQQDTK